MPNEKAEKTKKQEPKILVRGGASLSGNVKISGAKNAVLKIMAASVLIPGEITLANVPPLDDVFQMMDILEFLGGKCNYDEASETLSVDFSVLDSHYAPFELVSKLRASFVVLGPILSRLGMAKVSLPGGCQIGARRTDLHEKGLKQLGAKLSLDHGYIEAEAISADGKLLGAEIYLDIPSNGATENLMMAAVLAKGTTTIRNAAKDPEIADLANFLNKCGARIMGAGSETIIIEGVNLSDLHGTNYRCLPDRIEAGTFVIAGLATRGDIIVTDVIPSHLSPLLSKLKEAGADFEVYDRAIRCISPQDGRYKGIEVSTFWYPGFPTDMQPQMMSFLTLCEGMSMVKETIFEDRFSHVSDLKRMGANITVNNNVATVNGVDMLSGTPVKGSDLRATAGLAIAGMMADGVTEVFGLSHLDRGYAHFTEKMQSLGAEITRHDIG